MRTFASVVLAAALALGCGSKSRPVDTTPANTPAASETAATDPAPAPAADPAAPAAGGGGVPMTDEEIAVAATKAIALMEALTVAIETNAADCPKMAVAIEKIVADNQAFIEQSRKWQGNQANDERMQAALQPTMEKLTPRLMGGMVQCSNDPKVAEALNELM